MTDQEAIISIIYIVASVIWHVIVAVCLFKIAFPDTWNSLFG